MTNLSLLFGTSLNVTVPPNIGMMRMVMTMTKISISTSTKN